MKSIKKFKIFLANDIEKEAKWLTEMSSKGLHFFKYKSYFYYVEVDNEKSYIYQLDFQDAGEEYFELYKHSGWEHIETVISQYHYFRADKNAIGDKRIYSDPSSIKNMYQRMLYFYITIFVCMLVAQIGLFLTWNHTLFSKIALAFVTGVILLYIYLFIRLMRKMRNHEKRI